MNKILLLFLLLASLNTGKSQKLNLDSIDWQTMNPYDLVLIKDQALRKENKVSTQSKIQIRNKEETLIEMAFYTKDGLLSSIKKKRPWVSEIAPPPKDFIEWGYENYYYDSQKKLVKITDMEGKSREVSKSKCAPQYTCVREFDQENLIFTSYFKDSLNHIKGKTLYHLNPDYTINNFNEYNQVSSSSSIWLYNSKGQLTKLIVNYFERPKQLIKTFEYFENGLLKYEKIMQNDQRNLVNEYKYEYSYH